MRIHQAKSWVIGDTNGFAPQHPADIVADLVELLGIPGGRGSGGCAGMDQQTRVDSATDPSASAVMCPAA